MIRYFLTLCMAAMLIGCGGSGGGISGTGITTDSNDVVVGTIEGFGSVIVNQTRLETGDARITVNGSPSTQAGLRVGMQVRINANLESLTATRIDYVPLVVGPVRDVDAINNTLEILGHTIRLTTETRYHGIDGGSNTTSPDTTSTITASAIAENTVLEVSGFVNNNQQIVATFVRLVETTDQYQLLANVSSLQQGFDISIDLSDLEFTLAQLELQLQLLQELNEFDPFSTRRAVLTLPTGDSTTSPSLAFLLPTDNFVPGARADVLQVVTGRDGVSEFTTEDFVVAVTADTTIVFSSGIAADVQDIQPDRIVRVSGTIIDRSATIQAQQIVIF